MPARQPHSLLLLNGRGEGQDSAGREIATPPPFKRLAPEPPEWMSLEAADEWARVVPGLSRLDLVKPEDRAALTAYCELWSRWVTAIRDTHANGLTVRNESTRKDGTSSVWWTKNPAVAIAEQAETRLRQYANEFGLTPAGERNVSKRNDDRDPDELNPFVGSSDADTG